MAPVRAALEKAISKDAELQDLPLAVGKTPAKQLPSEKAAARARRRVARTLGLSRDAGEARHEAGKWRHKIGSRPAEVRVPDTPLVTLLGTGSPMWILEPITPGGLFRMWPAPAEADLLDNNFWTKGNHPSFGLTHGDDPEPPGLAILAGYYEKGYAARYSSMLDAERQHRKLILSPLGNLSKPKPDGSLKHRIVQDLRRGGANLLAAMFERIVLPRPTDHRWDLYSLWKKQARGDFIPGHYSL